MEIRKQQGVVVVSPSPVELEDIASTTNVFERMLLQAAEKNFIVDLHGMELIFSVQIGTLVAAHVLCREHGATMKVVSDNDKVKTLLRMVGLDKMIELHPELTAAVHGFKEPVAAGKAARHTGGPSAKY